MVWGNSPCNLSSTSLVGLLLMESMWAASMFNSANESIIVPGIESLTWFASAIFCLIEAMIFIGSLHLHSTGSGGSSNPRRTCTNLALLGSLLSWQIGQMWSSMVTALV
jgi:hypothetical protein